MVKYKNAESLYRIPETTITGIRLYTNYTTLKINKLIKNKQTSKENKE